MTLHEELSALAEKATPFVWQVDVEGFDNGGCPEVAIAAVSPRGVKVFPAVCLSFKGAEGMQKANAALIVALHNNLPAILAALAAVEKVRAVCQDVAGDSQDVRFADGILSMLPSPKGVSA